ncbi:MAG: hypothetical protein R6V03_04330 [Kiritimatiellia bacterium]
MNRVLIITGMHRSGTSVVAHWLNECGLFLGRSLLPGNESNPKGHFEDSEILDLQRRMLARDGLTHMVWGSRKIRIASEDRDRAEQVVKTRLENPQWGWKEPRTCLFLDFWKSLIPEAKCLFIYRHYAQSVASLKRREGRLRRVPPLSWYKTVLYTRVWRRYNKDVMAFASRHPADCMTFDIRDIGGVSLKLIRFMNMKWSFDLEARDFKDVFDRRYFHDKRHALQGIGCRLSYPGIADTYHALAELNSRSHQRVEDS